LHFENNSSVKVRNFEQLLATTIRARAFQVGLQNCPDLGWGLYRARCCDRLEGIGDAAVQHTLVEVDRMRDSELGEHGCARDVRVLDFDAAEFKGFQIIVNVAGLEIWGYRFGVSPKNIARAVAREVVASIIKW